jgi:hypothetical protein
MSDTLLLQQIVLSIKNNDSAETIYCYFFQLNDPYCIINNVDPQTGETILHMCLTLHRFDVFAYAIMELQRREISEIDSVMHTTGDTIIHRLYDLKLYDTINELMEAFSWDNMKANNCGVTINDLLTHNKIIS